MLEVSSNVIKYEQIYIQEETEERGLNITADGDLQTCYDDSVVTFECIQCGYALPSVESYIELEEYLEKQK